MGVVARDVVCVAPAESREACYRLLANRSPCGVVVDSDLRPDEWYVVRALTHEERVKGVADA